MMSAFQAGKELQHDGGNYSAQDEINQFMNRFLGFVSRDNSRARVAPEQLKEVGTLTVQDLSAALDKVDQVFQCLDNERLRSVQYSIQVEALNSLHRATVLTRDEPVANTDEAALRQRCQDLQDHIDLLAKVHPTLRLSRGKAGRINACRNHNVKHAKRRRRISGAFTD